MKQEVNLDVVIVHDLEHDNYFKLLSNANISAPTTIKSFTDLHPNYNPYNSELASNAEKADILFLPVSGLRHKSAAVVGAFAATRQSPNKIREIILYDTEFNCDSGYFNSFERACMEAIL